MWVVEDCGCMVEGLQARTSKEGRPRLLLTPFPIPERVLVHHSPPSRGEPLRERALPRPREPCQHHQPHSFRVNRALPSTHVGPSSMSGSSGTFARRSIAARPTPPSARDARTAAAPLTGDSSMRRASCPHPPPPPLSASLSPEGRRARRVPLLPRVSRVSATESQGGFPLTCKRPFPVRPGGLTPRARAPVPLPDPTRFRAVPTPGI